MEINLGYGKVALCHITRDGVNGLLLRPVEEAHEIGLIDPDPEPNEVEYILKDQDAVIWFHNLQSANVLYDVINIILTKLKV